MTSANVELVRSIFADWERGHFSSTAWADPEIEWVRTDGPDPGTWKGLTEVAKSTREFMSAWEGMRFQAEEYHELDAERVLVLVRLGGRGLSSGFELGKIQTGAAAVYHVHDGKVTRLVFYYDRERAFADPGIAAAGDSRRNVELVRNGFAAYNRGDLDTLIASCHPDVEFVTLLLGTHRGRDAIRAIYDANEEALVGYRLDPEEVLQAGEDQVIAVARLGGSGRSSRIALGERIAFLVTIKDGLVFRQESFCSKEDAAQAAGL